MAKKNQTTATTATQVADTAPVATTDTTVATAPAAVVFPGQVPPTDEIGVQITPEERAVLGDAGVGSEATAALGTQQTVIAATPEGTPGADRAEVAIVTLPGDSATTDGALLGGPREGGESKQALVLRDSPYGKCGQVRAFDAALVDGLERAGLIDSHPAAVQSAEG
ncbi:hypothetical protein [Xanthomonas citri]|uniref:hypothetical protein n=1 Tax=Xanthomonas citri TaxID=346 RepID=UPI0009C38464|nr:hypothetical protein [Xanthomonas citri]AMV02121.1 hypothetical protein TP50_06435 [Xanthomonas citri pv. aurantifolii]TBW92943.1 hypothetical protein TP49_23575 [Xanthomonas citri pv. aurantifolii]